MNAILDQQTRLRLSACVAIAQQTIAAGHCSLPTDIHTSRKPVWRPAYCTVTYSTFLTRGWKRKNICAATNQLRGSVPTQSPQFGDPQQRAMSPWIVRAIG